MTQQTSRALGACIASSLTLALLIACESDTTAPPEVFEEGQIAIDASSPVGFTYLSLADAGGVVIPPDPATSNDWHMGFRRFLVRLNGGVAGPGSVSAVNLGNNANASAEEIVALTEQDGEAAFEAVTEADIPAAGSFVEDGLAPDPGASWFRFDPLAGTLVANPGAAWMVREASGRGFAIFRVTKLRMQGQRPVGLEIEYRRHEPNGTLGTSGTIEGDLSRGPVFLGLADGSAVSPAGCGWDISATPDLTIEINAGCGAGTFPLDPAQDFTTLSNADDAPEYVGFLSVISGAFPSTVDDASGVFWYDIRENSRMWPTYNVFLVRVDDQVYKVQITNYYDAAGASGHPTVRFVRLR